MDDRAVVAQQLGREPRAFHRVAVRCPFGRPAVTEQAPYAPDGDESVLLSHPVRAPRAQPRLSDDFRFAAAVAEFGMLLRGSEHRGRSSLDDVMTLARGSLGEDPQGHRRSFLRLVEDYRRLPGGDADPVAR